MMKLYVFTGYGHNQSFELVGSNIYVGRSEENDIQLADILVSRRHLEVIEKDNRIFIQDLNSSNGTYINGEKITPDKYFEINEHDPIVIGMTLICVGKKCLDYTARSHNPLSNLPGDTDSEKNTTFLRPFSDIKNNELIKDINDLLHVSSDIKEISEKLLDHILNHFLRADRVVILLFIETPHGGMTETVVSRSKTKSPGIDREFSRLIVDRVIKSRNPLVIQNVTNEKETELSRTLKILKIGSVMCVPIIKGDKLIGVFYIDSYEKPFGFRKDDLKLITEISNLTAKSINSYLG